MAEEDLSDMHRFKVSATAESHFSWIRTRLSLERTLMSWVRTAISLIGFGFTIVQFFQRMTTIPGVNPPLAPEGPRYFGLALIGSGVAALAISVSQYWSSIRYLRSPPYDRLAASPKHRMQTPIIAVCLLLMLIGILAFFAILIRAI